MLSIRMFYKNSHIVPVEGRAAELHHRFRRYLYGSARQKIPPHARRFFGDFKRAEPRDRDLVACAQGIRGDVDERVDTLSDVCFGDARSFGNGVDELSFIHKTGRQALGTCEDNYLFWNLQNFVPICSNLRAKNRFLVIKIFVYLHSDPQKTYLWINLRK